jgi:hypothetical protein
MTKQNQGFRRDLNLQETTNETTALNNLGGAGIAGDLRILQNNLRNTSTLPFNTVVGAAISSGYFYFGSISEFVFTNDDVVGVRTDITVGVGVTLYKDNTYYICNSNGENRFKLSTTPSTVGVNIITVSSISSSFDFVRKDPVYKENILNLVKPNIQDTENFNYLGGASINSVFDSVAAAKETAGFFITKKYKENENTVSNNDIIVDGSIIINDPENFNAGSSQLLDVRSPGMFIGDTRAFSSDNNPWTQVGTALSTLSSSVSIGELYFANDITITGISTESNLIFSVRNNRFIAPAVTTYTHKLPVTINGETYSILLST